MREGHCLIDEADESLEFFDRSIKGKMIRTVAKINRRFSTAASDRLVVPIELISDTL